jgi:protoporphyrinogen oxidase
VLDPHAMRHIKPFAGAVGINQPFYSILSRDVVPHEKYRGVVMHMPYQGNNQSNDQTRYASARKLISQILGLPDNAFIEQTCCDQSVPKLNTDYKNIQKEMISHLPQGMHITGNYFARLAIEDCVRQAKQCIDKLN